MALRVTWHMSPVKPLLVNVLFKFAMTVPSLSSSKCQKSNMVLWVTCHMLLVKPFTITGKAQIASYHEQQHQHK